MYIVIPRTNTKITIKSDILKNHKLGWNFKMFNLQEGDKSKTETWKTEETKQIKKIADFNSYINNYLKYKCSKYTG